MSTQQEGAETTGRGRNPLARRGGDSDAGEEQAAGPEAGDAADEPGIDEQATAEAPAEDTPEEPSEPMICAICDKPIEGPHLMAAYGPVHDPECSSQTKRVP